MKKLFIPVFDIYQKFFSVRLKQVILRSALLCYQDYRLMICHILEMEENAKQVKRIYSLADPEKVEELVLC